MKKLTASAKNNSVISSVTFAVVLVFALVIPFAFAQSSGATGSSFVFAHLEYSVLVPSAATDVVFSAYAFGNTSAQSATFNSSDAYSLSGDAYGNSVLSFRYKPAPGEANKIAIDALVNVSYDPSRYDFEPVAGGVDYLSQSKLVILDPQAASLANSITSNATRTEETVAALSSWVYENIVYDSRYKDSAMDSSTTLAVGRGTCDEKAHLLEALLRSKAIPARHVVGFAYSGTDWEPHAWVEAAINGSWAPVDPTFNELFFIDATHLRLAVGRDQEDTKYSIKATGTSNLSGTTVAALSNFSFESQSPYSHFFSFSASFPQEVHKASETAKVNATVRNALSRTIAVPLLLSLHPDFSSQGPREQVLVIPAGSQASVSWEVVYPFKVAGGYSYNYSSTVSAYGFEQAGFLLASQSSSSGAMASVSVENFAAKKLSDGVQLYFWLRNSGSAPVSAADLELSVSDSKFTKAIGYMGVGTATRVEFLVPYSLVSPSGRLEANISVRIGYATFNREVAVELSEGPAVTPAAGTLDQEVSSALSSPLFLASALTVIVASIILAFVAQKKRFR